MSNTLIIIVPLLLLIVLWIALAQLRRAPLQASTNFGLAATLITMTVFGLWTMVSLNLGEFSGLVIYVWITYGVPVGLVTYLLGVSSFILVRSKQLWRLREQDEVIDGEMQLSRRKAVLSLVFVALFLVIVSGYFYIKYLESRFEQQATEANLRHLYHNPVVRLFPHLRVRLGHHHSIPLDMLARLFDDSNQSVWWAACMNDKATHELLRKASKSSWPNNKECVLANRNAPVELLREWSRDDDDRIRRYIARHNNTPPDVLLLLSRDDSQSVQGSVATNAAAPGEALTQLATSDNPMQRSNVAAHANTPVSVLEQLAKDPDPKVRLRVLSHVHQSLHIHIIETLLNDTNEEVRAMATRRLIDHQR